jgi:ATP-dependent DNA ligase
MGVDDTTNEIIKSKGNRPGEMGRSLSHGINSELFQKLQTLVETGRSRWGESLGAEKMKQCVWVKPRLTARIEFLERTEGGRPRHSRFVRLND